MKKALSLLLALVMCLILCACGKDIPAEEVITNTQNVAVINEAPSTTDDSTNQEEPEESVCQTESLEAVRTTELVEILCGGKWIAVDGNISDSYPTEMCFFEDGTMTYKTAQGDEHIESWIFSHYVINGEIEGQPGFSPAAEPGLIEYSNEHGRYHFQCGELTINLPMIVGMGIDGEYIINDFGWAYKKIIE